MVTRGVVHALAVLAALALSCSGCTLVGLGVGSTIDRYRDFPAQPAPKDCAQERVVLKAPAPPARAADRNAEVIARTPTGVVVRQRGKVQPLEYGRVSHTECRVGSHALAGAAFGALADGAVLLTVIVYELSRTDLPSSTKF